MTCVTTFENENILRESTFNVRAGLPILSRSYSGCIISRPLSNGGSKIQLVPELCAPMGVEDPVRPPVCHSAIGQDGESRAVIGWNMFTLRYVEASTDSIGRWRPVPIVISGQCTGGSSME